MVSTITPGAAPAHGANVVGVETRMPRTGGALVAPQGPAAQRDQVELSMGSLSAARQSVRAGLDQIQTALEIGRDAQAMLINVEAMVRRGASQEELEAALSGFAQRLDAALSGGARLVAGENISIDAEPGAAAIVAPGMDLRLRAAPRAGDLIQVGVSAQIDDAGLAEAAQRSFENVQAAMTRLADSARALEAHQGFIRVAESALTGSVRHDLDADGAQLLALQVRQGLEAAGGRAIANAEPRAVLALFRA
jgi:hypothetical protein